MSYNYFDTLSDALRAAVGRQLLAGAVFDEQELSDWNDKWNGGVSYGQTVTHICPVATLKGKPTRKAMTVVIYRMDKSGRYELTSYIA